MKNIRQNFRRPEILSLGEVKQPPFFHMYVADFWVQKGSVFFSNHIVGVYVLDDVYIVEDNYLEHQIFQNVPTRTWNIHGHIRRTWESVLSAHL